jgi:hypothetical protein
VDKRIFHIEPDSDDIEAECEKERYMALYVSLEEARILAGLNFVFVYRYQINVL